MDRGWKRENACFLPTVKEYAVRGVGSLVMVGCRGYGVGPTHAKGGVGLGGRLAESSRQSSTRTYV